MFDRRPWRLVGAFLLTGLLLAGCGGGGGGSGGSGNSGGTPSTPGDTAGGSVPDDPPALATPDYIGESGAAPINEFDAAAYAGEVMVMVNAAAGLTAGAPLTFPSNADTISQTQSGPAGGTAVIQGRRRDDGTAWLSIDYQDYQQKDSVSGEVVTLNGLAVFEFTAGGHSVEMDLSQYELSSDSSDVVLDGSILEAQTATSDEGMTTAYTENLVLHDKLLQAYIKTQDLVANYTQQQYVTVDGRLYDSRGGYVTLSTDNPLKYNSFDGISTPYSGGPIRLSGAAGGAAADLVVLNANFASVGLDSNGDGVADEAARLDLSTFAPDVTATPGGAPEADLGPATGGSVGGSITLNGRYSHSEDGGFVHFQWTLAMAPAGSTATLTGVTTANPTLVPDLAGDYLVRLEASNASGTSSDAMVVQANASSGDTSSDSDAAVGPDAGPNQDAVPGNQVALDGRSSSSASGGPSNYQWHLYTPEGSQAVLNSSTDAQPTFTPDVAGYYYATLGSCCDARASAVIDAGGPVHLGRPSGLGDFSARTIAVGDLNDDGLPDLVINGSAATNSVLVMYNHGGGRFSAPAAYTLGDGQFAIGDVNGDGLADLVTGSGVGINYRLQQPDGSLGPVENVTGTSTYSGYYGAVLAKLFGASRDSAVTEAGYDSLTIYGPITGGAIGNPVQIALSGVSTLSAFAAGDVTGDGITDLLAVNYYPNQLLVLAGKDDGTFAPPAVYPLTSNESSIVIGDINGDGKNDVILKTYGSDMMVLPQQTDGTLGSETAITTRGNSGTPTIADINGDGRDDIVFAESFTDPVSGSSREGIGIFTQQPDGSLSKEFIYPLDGSISGVRVADTNGDGIPDVITTASSEDGLRIALGIPADADGQTIQIRQEETEPRRPKRWRLVNVAPVLPMLPRLRTQ